MKNFTKTKKGRIKGMAHHANKTCFCDIGLQAISAGRLKVNQIEAGRKVLTKIIKKTGKILVRIKPNTPITKKPIEVRMGSGKGEIKEKIYKVKPGNVIYEVNYINTALALTYLKKAAMKLPVKTITITNI
ncbi:50S ribosomal protein L16 [Candidatus Vidania fulgoroideae]|uniref:50S ribosomal protein L16 n=1 Tax=Candidatus Vidania fulgoroideorum TaxID=881286 RepID=A0A975ADQ5_9PROT|nr:50S ribosomal protein L16 [Candidatus Vidania fulgoroideae]